MSQTVIRKELAAGKGKNEDYKLLKTTVKSEQKACIDGERKCKNGLEGQCFTEGTQIVVGEVYDEELCTTIYVTENIENVEVGDLVYSYDTVTGQVVQSEVTETFVRESDHINYLTIEDKDGNIQVIETTDEHPLWVVTESGGEWVEAKCLKIGDQFLDADGDLSTLISTERREENVTVYNFEVVGNHNYFVIAEGEYGQTCILVHNKCDSALLADDMIKNGIKRHADSAAHHIIPAGEGKAQKARDILKQYKIDINSHENGVFLPKAIHRGRHSGDYVTYVNNVIKHNAQSRADVIAALAKIRNGLLNGSIKLN